MKNGLPGYLTTPPFVSILSRFLYQRISIPMTLGLYRMYRVHCTRYIQYYKHQNKDSKDKNTNSNKNLSMSRLISLMTPSIPPPFCQAPRCLEYPPSSSSAPIPENRSRAVLNIHWSTSSARAQYPTPRAANQSAHPILSSSTVL